MHCLLLSHIPPSLSLSSFSLQDWVETELQAAKEGGEKVIIISHIPPGHVRHSEDWSERYLDRYITLCT